MTSIFTADSSTQGTGGFTNTKAFNTKDDANIKFFSKSGIYNSGDNTIKIFTNNVDALTIDANQKVICNGSLITNLDYNNISLNKPTLATVATSGSYNDLSGTPNLSIYLTSATASSTYLTIANASSTYATSANLTTQLGTKQNTLTSTTALVGNGSAITSLNYNNITNPPNLSGLGSKWTLSGANIYNNNTGNVGIGTNNPVGAHLNVHLKNQIPGAGAFVYVKLSSATSGNGIGQGFNLCMSEDGSGFLWNNTITKPIVFGTEGTERMRIDSSGNIGIGLIPAYKLDVNGNINGTEIFRSGVSLATTLATKQNTLTSATALVGNGSAITNLNYNNITNPPSLTGYATTTQLATKQDTLTSSTALVGNGANITSLNYNNITNPPSLSGYALTTSLTTSSNNNYNFTSNSSNFLINYNNLINTPNLSTYATTTQLAGKQDTLIASTALVGNGANITSLDYNNITNPPSLSSYATTTSLTTSSNNNYNYTSNSSNFLINYNNLINTPNLSTYATTTQLATKENALTFNSPLTRTTNAIGLSYDSSLNLNGTQLKVANPNLWAINGTNLSYSAGNVGIGITNSLRILHLHSPTDVGVYLQMTNSLSGSAAGNGCFFGMDATVLNFVVGNTNNADIYFRINGVDRMRIKNNGYVGIENNSPIGTLCLGNSSVVNSDGNLVIGKCTAVGTSRHFKIGIDGSYNFCIGDYGGNNTAATWQNTQLCINYSTGNVGIGVAPSATYKLNANGSINATEYYKNGAIYVPALASGLTGTPNITVGTITSTSITTNNNAINAGTGGLTCGTLTASSGIHNFTSYLYINSPVGTTHFPWSGNNENYIRGKLNVDAGNSYFSGYMGLGTNSPSTRLHIAGNWPYTQVNNSYYITNNWAGNGSVSFTDFCAIFDSSIWIKSWVSVSSDERIKENIEDINDETALQKILMIEPKTYNYKDRKAKGDNKVYGFIAQQVKEVIPEAVKLGKDYLPNIYKLLNVSENIITTDEDLTSILSINDKVKIIDNDKSDEYKILEISNEYIKVDKNIKNTQCFIYGKEVQDFHTLSKEYIFTLNVCATQELHRIIQKQQQEIDDLKTSLRNVLDRLNNFISS